jgi:hypothetical protein
VLHVTSAANLAALDCLAGRRHPRCLEKGGTFGTSHSQLYNKATLFGRAREGVMSPHGADFCPKLTDALREADKPFWQP